MASIGSQSRTACRKLGRGTAKAGPCGLRICTSARQPTWLAALAPSKKPSLLWGMRADGSASLPSGLAATFEIVSALDRCARNKAWNTAVGPADLTHRWTSEALHRRGAGFGLECLAWCRALPTLSGPVLAASEWWHLFEIALERRREQHEPGRWQRRPAVTAMAGRRVAADDGLLVSGNRADAPPGARWRSQCVCG